MSEKNKTFMDHLSRVLMWVGVLAAVLSSAASAILDAGLEVPAVVSSVLSILVLRGRVVGKIGAKLPEALVILGLSSAASIAVGTIEPVAEEPVTEETTVFEEEPWQETTFPSEDVLAPSDIAKAALGAIFPVGCTAVQKQAIAGAATRLGRCLAGLGIVAADSLVRQWASGEVVRAEDIGWGVLPEFLDCAVRIGASVVGGIDLAAAPMVRAHVVDEVPIEACGAEEDPEPSCVIILPVD